MNYKEVGIDTKLLDQCSLNAYTSSTKPKHLKFGITHLSGGSVIDMGDYFLTHTCDGIGTKLNIIPYQFQFNTFGYDLLAMVADDNICLGAETISITNTIDANSIVPELVDELMKGLVNACKLQEINISGGEIAILNNINGLCWNASAIGIVEKHKLIKGNNICVGDKIIGFKSNGFRSNGFTLINKILHNYYGPFWFMNKELNQQILTPSLIYSNALLSFLGRYGEKRTFNVKALKQVTGGGLLGNLKKITSPLCYHVDNLPSPLPIMIKIQRLGNVQDTDAYNTWNMGIGMLMITDESEISINKLAKHLKNNYDINMLIIGSVTDSYPYLYSKGAFKFHI